MAREAERLLADTGWLPESLRIIHSATDDTEARGHDEADELPEFLVGNGGDEEPADEERKAQHMAAAE